MRELQIVQTVLDQVLCKVQEGEENQVTRLQPVLDERSSIQRHWQKISKGTLAEQAELRIRLITAEVQCIVCFQNIGLLTKRSPAAIAPYGSFDAKS